MGAVATIGIGILIKILVGAIIFRYVAGTETFQGLKGISTIILFLVILACIFWLIDVLGGGMWTETYRETYSGAFGRGRG